MNYKTKVFICIIGTALFGAGISLAILDYKTEQMIWAQSQSKLLSIASTAVTKINGDDIEEVHRLQDESSEVYQRVQRTLRAIRDANRRSDVYVSYVYTLRRVPSQTDLLEFGIDAEESKENHSRIGDIYRARSGQSLNMNEPQADAHFTTDQWGNWLTASAPIKNSAGVPVAVLAIDVPAERLKGRLATERKNAFLALAVSVCFAVVVGAFLSRQSSEPLSRLKASIKKIEGGDLEIQVNIKSKDEFGEVARSIETMAVSLKQHQVLKSAFASYVSNQVMDTILASKSVPNPQGERRAVTVLFSDIRGFTDMAENLRPEEVVELLNEYFECMIEIVFKYGGTLDKFIGDGLMAIFGAPMDDPDHEEHAVRAALDMQRGIHELRKKWHAEGKRGFDIGIGINSGRAIVGNIGSSQRLQYTAVGDTVNVAARLESATKDMGCNILVSEYTFHALRRDFDFKKMGSLKVKGRTEEIVAYTLEA